MKKFIAFIKIYVIGISVFYTTYFLLYFLKGSAANLVEGSIFFVMGFFLQGLFNDLFLNNKK